MRKRIIQQLEKDVGKMLFVNLGSDQPVLAPNQYIMLGERLISGKFPLVSDVNTKTHEICGFIKSHLDINNYSNGYIFFKGDGVGYSVHNISNQMTDDEKSKIRKLWKQRNN